MQKKRFKNKSKIKNQTKPMQKNIQKHAKTMTKSKLILCNENQLLQEEKERLRKLRLIQVTCLLYVSLKYKT